MVNFGIFLKTFVQSKKHSNNSVNNKRIWTYTYLLLGQSERIEGRFARCARSRAQSEHFCVVHMFPKSTLLLWGYLYRESRFGTFLCGTYVPSSLIVLLWGIYLANIELERFCVVRSLKVHNSYGVSLIWEISQN